MNNNKFLKPALYLGWVFAFILLWLKCDSRKDVITNVVPEVKGSFRIDTIIKHDTITLKDIKIRYKDNEKLINDISVLYKENEALKNAYLSETDSLKREIMFLNSISLKEYSKSFEDENIKIDISGLVQGEVKSIKSDYLIKERTIETPIKIKNKYFFGVGFGTNLQFEKPIFNAGFGIQNKKQDILFINYNTENQYFLNYYKKIF